MLTPEQIADGWVEHDGGPCPVPMDSRPEMLFKRPINEVWEHKPSDKSELQRSLLAWMADWSNCVAYRPEPRHD